MSQFHIPVIDQFFVSFDPNDFPDCFGAECVKALCERTAEMVEAVRRMAVAGRLDSCISQMADDVIKRLRMPQAFELQEGLMHPFFLATLCSALVTFQVVSKQSYDWVYPLEVRKCLVATDICWLRLRYSEAAEPTEEGPDLFYWLRYQREHSLGSLIPSTEHPQVLARFAEVARGAEEEDLWILASLYFFLTTDRVGYGELYG